MINTVAQVVLGRNRSLSVDGLLVEVLQLWRVLTTCVCRDQGRHKTHRTKVELPSKS